MTEFAQDTLKPNLDNPAVPRVLQWLPAAFLLAVVGVGAGWPSPPKERAPSPPGRTW